MQKLWIVLLSMLWILPLDAQELRCRVQVRHRQIQGTQDQLYQSMQKDIYEFMNNRKWTNHVYANNERIECNIQINLTKRIGSEKFIGTFQVQSRRPVFNATYTTVMFNYQEKKNNFEFHYAEQQPLEFNENSHTSNLTSVLAFYAYIILGLDYDSFGNMAGTPYFEQAWQIVNNAQNAQAPGWKAFEGTKNRYWLAKNMLDETFSGLRECMYLYHRKGLDMMAEQTSKGRTNIVEGLKKLREVHQRKPNSFLMKLFLDAKSDEVVKIFSQAYGTQAKEVYNIMKTIDPSNADKYEKITKSNNP